MKQIKVFKNICEMKNCTYVGKYQHMLIAQRRTILICKKHEEFYFGKDGIFTNDID